MLTAKFEVGDSVNVRYKDWVDGVFTVSHTWYTTTHGRQYNVLENGDTFREADIRPAASVEVSHES